MPGALLPDAAPPPRVLVVGCGALGRELVALTRSLPGVDLTCLPAELHNRPERIPDAVAARLRARGGDYDRVFVAYADCGTGGLLDRMLEHDFEGVERIPGAHCYEFFAGAAAFHALQEEEVGTFYLTDFLARNFERIVWRGLGLEQHPELLETYFGNYRRLVYLAQTEDPELVERARAAAAQLGLEFECRHTGLGDLATAIRIAVSDKPGGSAARSSGAQPISNAASLTSMPGDGLGRNAASSAADEALDGGQGRQVSVASISAPPRRGRTRRSANLMAGTLTVIWWRDIPAQVIAKDKRRASKIVLHPRFQVAIDRAALKAGRREMDAYIAEWRKEQRRCGDDLEAAARDEAERLEAHYTKERLNELVSTGGVDETKAAS